ncbi:hypothetical protein ASPZODRAFT_16155 [Penicilliopsis zonata CBS 506.65]|uniref:DRBM domain-containing protein n=1 Tax=Penicilliopsis zonata CBS 506.65 TaxID=1073090 RepID=A0A1L9SH02_9EURO|nr:hypothetical protein ASPZODRAFT_16155 [Penicilliopsis zonata CBS 506.65]OJJ46387.1 hypothetical protein ASPZODRAFT_16155 [Penicilliopsis zonata CBS 506.65]
MPSPQSNNGGSRPSWQDRLNEHCRSNKLTAPVFNIVSDRRGGRTAWSSTVTISGQNIAARYWYDGQYINNAREDAAEVALQALIRGQCSSPVFQGQLYSQQPNYLPNI